jgi:hypothetical protein
MMMILKTTITVVGFQSYPVTGNNSFKFSLYVVIYAHQQRNTILGVFSLLAYYASSYFFTDAS